MKIKPDPSAPSTREDSHPLVYRNSSVGSVATTVSPTPMNATVEDAHDDVDTMMSEANAVAEEGMFSHAGPVLNQASPAEAAQLSDGSGPAIVAKLGHHVQDLLLAIDKLGQLGIETADLPLPKIIVIGDQSAGKSSLVEGMSDIKVPRSDGTCTKCPFQITLTASTDPYAGWRCRITLVKKYSLYSEPSTDDSSLGRWWPDQIVDETLFTEVHNKDALEDALRRAQWATLNPGDLPSKYLKMRVHGQSEPRTKVGFSPNHIRLDIAGGGLPNLSFYDLPGIINQTEIQEDNWHVKLVKQLAKNHIRQGNALILLALPMEVDVANSSAAKLVNSVPGASERTMAVLTKPDRYAVGNTYKNVQKLLEDKSYRFGYGYFVAKQPSQSLLNDGVTHAQARQDEAQFFSQPPWSTDLAKFKHRFGTPYLQEALSEKLVDQIVSSLPGITKKIEDRLSAVEQELSGYPDPPANASAKIEEALAQFATLIASQAKGAPPFNRLRNEMRVLAVKFRDEVMKGRPDCIVSTPSTSRTTTLQGSKLSNTILLDSDDEGNNEEAGGEQEEEEPGETPTPTPIPRRPGRSGIMTPVKRQKLDDGSPAIKKLQFSTPRGKQVLAHPVSIKKRQYEPLRLDSLRQTLSDLGTSDVPNEVDPGAVDYVRQQTVLSFEFPLEVFLTDFSTLLHAQLQCLLYESCDQWKNTEFFREATKIVSEFTTNTMAEQRAFAHRLLSTETHKIATIQESVMRQNYQREFEKLHNDRLEARIVEHLKRTEEGPRSTSLADKKNKARKDTGLRKQFEAMPDLYEKEVDVMARVRAYYNVAALRFIDSIINDVQHHAPRGCKDALPQQLRAGLMLDVGDMQERAAVLLAEDARREARRTHLKGERERLLEARKWLDGLDAAADVAEPDDGCM